ncbi:CTP synthase [Thermosulfuriphilus ammonigenes]|uniref:CTP synthase n=1 Tax=Thermosulfuriphilus ammonigenes TaxID=1936021 RepID=A0A6G7PYC4_9BACT|nr:CTP synthase [Thermosulfuriphilus ammonigenes]MBA2849451.1 CTP synthase [Thermosulfuriphilus ammonigenes]QIJ72521.1 CTP synthase [Thermosulfuriphilus ammonigenes]
MPRRRRHSQTKFIFITGGVLSSLGKGLAAAAIGALLESRGLRVTFQKLDPYINVDPGTMNPFQHGEVFVTDDGAETDLDLGHYERFTSAKMGKKNNYTSGRIYFSVITKERRGDYLGGTVQIIPHVTDEIKAAIRQLSGEADVAIVEIGGTVGDIEGLPFLEAIRQLRADLGRENTLYIHLTYIPYIRAAGEVKTKPTQHSVKELRAIGIQPDILMCRTEQFLTPEIKAKIALFCNVDEDAVITAKDVDCIYEIPLIFHKEGLDEKILELLNIWTRSPVLKNWEDLVYRLKHPQKRVRIAVVGKYVHLKDSYKSLHEAIVHGGMANSAAVEITYLDSEELGSENVGQRLNGCHGVLVPGGFGSRGIEGKILAINWARENKIPFFGICLGMQLAVIEFARNVAGLHEANSTEFDPTTAYPVIYLMKEWFDYRTQQVVFRDEEVNKGGTMRLGAYPCRLTEGTFAHQAYSCSEIYERHRHRYEFNNRFRETLEKAGLRISGTSPDGKLVEIIEVADHPWFLGCQFHPEFKSKPMAPHPLFAAFIRAALDYQKSKSAEEKAA